MFLINLCLNFLDFFFFVSCRKSFRILDSLAQFGPSSEMDTTSLSLLSHPQLSLLLFSSAMDNQNETDMCPSCVFCTFSSN